MMRLRLSLLQMMRHHWNLHPLCLLTLLHRSRSCWLTTLPTLQLRALRPDSCFTTIAATFCMRLSRPSRASCPPSASVWMVLCCISALRVAPGLSNSHLLPSWIFARLARSPAFVPPVPSSLSSAASDPDARLLMQTSCILLACMGIHGVTALLTFVDVVWFKPCPSPVSYVQVPWTTSTTPSRIRTS